MTIATIRRLELPRAGRFLDLSRPRVMGVLNVTPDSFSDGGWLYTHSRVDIAAVCAAADAMVGAGAAVLDIGGESTRPGATPVSEQEELDRVLPVIEALRGRFDAALSVDTSTPAVMREAARAGADLINDVRALRRDGAIEAAAETGLPVCLMHMQGTPETMQERPAYDDVVAEVAAFLTARVNACVAHGIDGRQILLDPGFGFGKSLEHNLELLRRLPELAAPGNALLVGLSRKSLIGKLTGRDVGERLPGGLALALLAAQRGARLLRVHDVAETVDVLRVLQAVNNEDQP